MSIKIPSRFESASDLEEALDDLMKAVHDRIDSDPREALRLARDVAEQSRRLSFVPGHIRASLEAAGVQLTRMHESAGALPMLEAVIKDAKSAGDTASVVRCKLLMGVASMLEGDYVTALDTLGAVLDEATRGGDERLAGKVLANIAMVHEGLGQYEKALEATFKSLALVEKFDEKRAIGANFLQLGNIHDELGSREKAREYYLKAADLASKHKFQSLLASSYANISSTLDSVESGEESLEYVRKALAIFEKIGDRRHKAVCLNSLATIHLELGDDEAALELFRRSHEASAKIHGVTAACSAINIGRILTLRERWDEAESFLGTALQSASDAQLLQELEAAHRAWAELAVARGDYERAYNEHVKAVRIKEQRLGEEAARRIEQLRMQFEVERKEKEAEIYRLKSVELAEANDELQRALENVKVLSGLVPICAHCKKIRDDQGFWNQLEKYISERSDARFSHGICPECAEEHFPGLLDRHK